MSSNRKAIRAYITARLINQTAAEDRVYDARILPTLKEQGFPMVSVFTPSETKERMLSETPPIQYERVARIEIEVVIRKNDTYASDLDDLCDEIEALMDYTLGGTCEECEWNSFDTIMDDKGEMPFIIGQLVYTAKYTGEEPLIDIDSLPDLETIHTDWDMANPNDGTVTGPDGTIDAIDSLENLHL